jgi:hypothetical protein
VCFYDGVSPAVHTVTSPKARKVHYCSECAVEIQIGEVYERSEGLWDGTFYTFKTCVRCQAVRNAVTKAEEAAGCFGSEAFCPHGELLEYLRELSTVDVEALLTTAQLPRNEWTVYLRPWS